MKIALSPYKAHVNKWFNCTRCDLHLRRKSVVLARGSVPCDVLFIGEAPGVSEDVKGIPFFGPAGKLLDQIIARSVPESVKIAFTNIVACIPLGDDKKKAAEPDIDDIKACRPRLVEFVRMARPRLIVLVGQLAKRHIPGQSVFDPVNWLEAGKYIQFVEVDHPAYILRLNSAQRGLATQRAEVRIRCAVEELYGGN